MITRQSDTIWSQSAAGRGHQHRPAYDQPHQTYHADKATREYGEAMGIKHRTEAEHADQPRDKNGRFLPMPHHEKEKESAAREVRRKGGKDLEDHFHHGYRRGYEQPHLVHHKKEVVQEEHHHTERGRAASVKTSGPPYRFVELRLHPDDLTGETPETFDSRHMEAYTWRKMPFFDNPSNCQHGYDSGSIISMCPECRDNYEGDYQVRDPYDPEDTHLFMERNSKVDEDDEEEIGDAFSDITSPWEEYTPDPHEEQTWKKNPIRVPKIPRPHERTLKKDPYLLENNEIANARGLRLKGLHLSQPKDMVGHLLSEPQHYFNDDQSHNFSVIHHVVDPAHSKSGMWEVHRWKYSSDPKEGGSVEVTHHLPNETAVDDVAQQLASNLDWDKHEGIGGRRVNKEWEERYIHEHPANNSMLDPIQYEIRFINAHRIRDGNHEYYYDPDVNRGRWMPHPSDPKKQFQGPHWMVTTKLWQRQHQFDSTSGGRYVTVDHKLFHPDDAHGALRYVYADQHGGSLQPRQGSIFSRFF